MCSPCSKVASQPHHQQHPLLPVTAALNALHQLPCAIHAAQQCAAAGLPASLMAAVCAQVEQSGLLQHYPALVTALAKDLQQQGRALRQQRQQHTATPANQTPPAAAPPAAAAATACCASVHTRCWGCMSSSSCGPRALSAVLLVPPAHHQSCTWCQRCCRKSAQRCSCCSNGMTQRTSAIRGCVDSGRRAVPCCLQSCAQAECVAVRPG